MKKSNRATKLHIKKGDKVQVIAGNYKGDTGEVLEVLISKNRAIVEDVNVITKHIKPTQEKPEGGRIKTEAGIHISNLMLVDPKTGEATKTGRKLDDKGKLRRYSKKTNEFVD